ncbi:MAG: phosphotransferase [Chloroflexi bacterium]|nr:phosphotransferase [Chloroflexota bacterium]
MPLSTATTTTLCHVLASYGIAPESLHDIRSGRANKHWRVVAGDRSYALRRYAPNRTLPMIRWEQGLTAHVAALGWPVPAAMATLDGGHVVEQDGARYALFPFLPGHPPPYGNLRYLATKGRLLARLHGDMATWTAPGQRPGWSRAAEPDEAVQRAGFADSNHLLAPFARHDPDAAARLGAAYAANVEEMHRFHYRSLPDTPVHNDFHNDNIFFVRGRLSAVVDFDSVRLDARLADVAQSIWLDCHTPPDYDTVSLPALSAFLGGYTAISPLDDLERRLLLPFIEAAILGYAGNRLNILHAGDNPKALRSLYRTVNRRLPLLHRDRQAIQDTIDQLGS